MINYSLICNYIHQWKTLNIDEFCNLKVKDLMTNEGLEVKTKFSF